jgi:flavin-dependent dehydrogenase
MMEKYDVIIIGAGIAGCGLAYNLKKFAPEKKVLIIEKNRIGSNNPINRNTFEDIINKYELPYDHIYDGVKIFIEDKELVKININFFFINYEKSCHALFNSSSAKLKIELARKINDNTLVTDNGSYRFRYLVDCSGTAHVVRRLMNLKLPEKLFIGQYAKKVENNTSIENYFCYSTNSDGRLEEIYPSKDYVIYGSWKFIKRYEKNKKILFNKSKFAKKFISKKIELIDSVCVIPCSPAFPLVKKNVAFLGDSFGNATPSAAEGIQPILDSSEILAKAIKKENLDIYKNEWKKKYLNLYIKHYVLKSDTGSRLDMIKKMGGYPDIIYSVLRNKDIKLPAKIMKEIPLKRKIKILFKCLYYRFLFSDLGCFISDHIR